MIADTPIDPGQVSGWVEWLLKIFALADQLINDPKNLIIVGLWCVGFLCKQNRFIHNDWIPTIILVVAIGVCIFAFEPIWQALLRAIFYTTTAVFGNLGYQKWIKPRLGFKDAGDDINVTVSSPAGEDQTVKASAPAVITIEKPTQEKQP